ncbi:MAG: hypothetical protein J7513_06580 [Solirubrobacteraceae bacterium]|nr:hypothetical protein [Solirubrobacteraceae bacterium]
MATPLQPLIPSADAPLVVKPTTGFFSVTSARGHLEWDGTTLTYRVGVRRCELVRSGEGLLLRLTFAGPMMRSRGPRLLWIGPDGRERAELDERQWPLDEILHVAALARIAVVELGTITYRELYERYPSMAPTIGGLDPQTPVSWDAVKQVARHEFSGAAKPSARDHARLLATGAMLAVTLGWLALRAAGVVG